MLTLPEKALFLILTVVSIYYTYRGFRQIIDVIRKGQPEIIEVQPASGTHSRSVGPHYQPSHRL